jgi:hypothetical protein
MCDIDGLHQPLRRSHDSPGPIAGKAVDGFVSARTIGRQLVPAEPFEPGP